MSDKKEEKPRKKIIIYDTGKQYWCFEDEIYDPSNPPPREKNISYSEKEE